MRLFPLPKNGKNTNLFGLFHFHNQLKQDHSCYYEWKFEIRKAQRNVYSADKRISFHFQSEGDGSCTYVLFLIYTLPPLRTFYGRPLTLYMLYFSLGIRKYIKVIAFFLIIFIHKKKTCSYGTDALYVIYILVHYTFIIWYSPLKDSSQKYLQKVGLSGIGTQDH